MSGGPGGDNRSAVRLGLQDRQRQQRGANHCRVPRRAGSGAERRIVTVAKLAIDGIVIGLHSDERYGEVIGRDEMRIGGFDDSDRNDKRDRISWI